MVPAAGLLLIDQREGGEAAGGKLDILFAVQGYQCAVQLLRRILLQLFVRRALVVAVERVKVDDIEGRRGVGVVGHRPVEIYRLAVAQGHIGVAVAAVHQIQVLELVEIVAVGDAGIRPDDFIADVINEHLVVQHFVGQQVDGVLVGDLHLAVVDVVRNVRRGHRGDGVPRHIVCLVLHRGSDALLCRTANGEGAFFNLDRVGKCLVGMFGNIFEHRLYEVLIHPAGVDGHGVGPVLLDGRDFEFVADLDFPGLWIRKLEPNGILAFLYRFHPVDITGDSVHRVGGAGSAAAVKLNIPGPDGFAGAIGKGQVTGEVNRLSRAFQHIVNLLRDGEQIACLRQAAAADNLAVLVRDAVIAVAAGVNRNVRRADGDILGLVDKPLVGDVGLVCYRSVIREVFLGLTGLGDGKVNLCRRLCVYCSLLEEHIALDVVRIGRAVILSGDIGRALLHGDIAAPSQIADICFCADRRRHFQCACTSEVSGNLVALQQIQRAALLNGDSLHAVKQRLAGGEMLAQDAAVLNYNLREPVDSGKGVIAFDDDAGAVSGTGGVIFLMVIKVLVQLGITPHRAA